VIDKVISEQKAYNPRENGKDAHYISPEIANKKKNKFMMVEQRRQKLKGIAPLQYKSFEYYKMTK